MSDDDRRRWNEKYSAAAPVGPLQADDWLIEAVDGVSPGRALELACGLGENAVWLATRGWQVDAVDVSATGLQAAARLATRHRVTPRLITGDLDRFLPLPNTYDLVVVFRFLDRHRLPRLVARALVPGGLLVHETFGPGQCDRPDNHLKNPAFVLGRDELPALYDGLEVVRYEEAVLTDRSVGRLIARQPAGREHENARSAC
jgi:tellurite methyltransferase